MVSRVLGGGLGEAMGMVMRFAAPGAGTTVVVVYVAVLLAPEWGRGTLGRNNREYWWKII